MNLERQKSAQGRIIQIKVRELATQGNRV